MKISYKVLQKYIKNIKTPEEVSKDLVMHTAEVEDIILEGKHLEKVFVGEVLTCEKHPDSEKLNCTTVKVQGKTYPIVCGAPNVKAGIKVPVAMCGAALTHDFVIKKTKIRGEISEGMICSEDELGLILERQEGIFELPAHAELDISMRDYLEKNDAILEIDNKAINHRPDLFSHIGIIREIHAINNERFDFEYENRDFSSLNDLGIKNEIPEAVSRYMGVKIENVQNIQTPDYIKQVLNSAEVVSKGLLVDITNYSLYLYGQPTHCFDADKIEGKIQIRYAKDGEKFEALNDSEYELSSKDIVIADDKKVIALGGVIGGKNSCVTDETKNIIVESAHFDQAIVRQTGKRLGLRTDALNVFEKDIVNGMQHVGMSLIVSELEKNIDGIKLTASSDLYTNKQEVVTVPFDLKFINNLIGKEYTKEEALNILANLGITESGSVLTIPFWRKDINYKADIAEEIARIDGYNNIKSTVPRINIGAVAQTNTYKIKNDVRNYFTNKGYFDMYTYSFVNNELMEKVLGNVKNLVPMKNALSEELTHLRGSLIPNLMLSLEKNIREFDNLKIFELEKIFNRDSNEIIEEYSLAGVEIIKKDIAFYDIQNTVSDLFKTLGVNRFMFDVCEAAPSYAHKGRTAKIMLRGQGIGTLGEIHPKVANNFEIQDRIGYFEINVEKLKDALYSITKAKEVSNFQENNFDLNFVVEKTTKAKDIQVAISKTDMNLIKKVELIDIYENDETLKGKRSLTYKIFIQSMDGTLDDKVKGKLIDEIIKKVEKKGGELR